MRRGRFVAQTIVASEQVVATNTSSWSWEDDANDKTATVYADDRGNLRLEIREVHTKYGLGAGKRDALREDVSLGTVFKPNLRLAITLLKQYSHDRTRAGSPFSRTWRLPNGMKAMLGDAIAMYAHENTTILTPPETTISDDEKRQVLMNAIGGLSGRQLDDAMKRLGL